MLIRGLNVVVLNEVTGAVMSSRWYDTYESEADSGLLVKYLKGLRQGRIVCFAVKVRLITLLIFVQYFRLQNKHFKMARARENERFTSLIFKKSFPPCFLPLFQNEAWCSFIWKEVFLTRSLSCKSNSSPSESLNTRTRNLEMSYSSST